ncbi:MAG: ABC transporter permease [Candidatus Hydrogenedentes bacterium]|nr:ABC transporter permease [Candidatus Hydrogenedentota bacterium]
MGFLLVLKAELVRAFIIMRRYWFATLTSIIIGYGVLLMLILTFFYNRSEIQGWADKTIGENATNWALGFIVGMFAFGIVGLFSQGLQGMARSGELEQVYMSPHGLITNFLARSFVASVSSILSSALMLWLIALSVKGKLHADFGPTLVLLALTYLNLIGFGFMVGGLVLVFKQTGQIAILIRTALIFLAIFATKDVENWWLPARLLAHILPITDAAICLKMVLIEGIGTDVFAQDSFWFLIISSAIWTFLGISCFKIMENWSRDKGTLGAY